MTSSTSVRVRFAPSPTGMMHLGNVRAALMNYLFATQKKGTFILRIEDTDQERNFDPKATQIIEDLLWLGLDYQEGPIKGGHYEPYFQSERTSIYAEKLTVLEHRNRAYRCFCSVEELEKKRQRQLALKMPPRYDRTCMKLSPHELSTKLANKEPFIWRFKLDQESTIVVTDLARGPISFDFKNFSDFALTRTDGSFTFMFANFVDDMTMVISHVIRGEDHLTNTAGQAALYQAFGIELPIFWHLPIIGNALGQKLSKRDFGFSLNDLRTAGYLPEAIDNYLAIIGGGTFEKEIMTKQELAQAINFDNLHSTGQIRYDVEKLRWMNHKWMQQIDNDELVNRCLPFLHASFAQAKEMDRNKLASLIIGIKTDLVTLADCAQALKFYFEYTAVSAPHLIEHMTSEQSAGIKNLVAQHLNQIDNPQGFIDALKAGAKEQNIGTKQLFTYLRLALTNSTHGPALPEIIRMLGSQESKARLESVLA